MQWSSHIQRVIVEVCIHCATGQDAKAFHTETLNNFMLRTWPNEFLTAEGISERWFCSKSMRDFIFSFGKIQW